MAITFVGVGAVNIPGTGDMALTEFVGSQPGDLIVAACGYRDSPTFTMPAGWTLVAQEANPLTSGSTNLASGFIAYKIRGASAEAPTFTRTGGDVAIGNLYTYRGVDPNDPFDTAVSATMAANATAIVTGAGITPAENGELFVMLGASASLLSPWASAEKANVDATLTWTERTDRGSSVGSHGGQMVSDTVQTAATATGTFQFTSGASARQAILVAAFKPLFDPSVLPGLVSWYDAQDAATITQSGGAVSQWNDKSATGANLLAGATAPVYDANGFNGLPAISFDAGAGNSISASSGPAGPFTGATIFVVADGTFFSYCPLINAADSSGDTVLELYSFGTLNLFSTFSPPEASTVASLVDAPSYLTVSRTSGGSVSFRVNGVDDTAVTVQSPASISATIAQLTVGCDAGGSTGTVRIREVIWYNRSLTSTEVGQVEAYLIAHSTPPPAPTGTASGSSTASAVGVALKVATGSASGAAAATGVGRSTAKANGTASGTSTASAAGQTIKKATGSASGTSTTAATGKSVTIGIGTATGSSTVAGSGVTLKKSVGTATGTATSSATGQATTQGTGSAAGQSQATGTGRATATGTGQTSGTATVSAVGKSIATAIGEAAGSSDAEAVGAALANSTGTAAGTSETEATGVAVTVGTGAASGTSTAEAAGAAAAIGTGAATGSSTAQAVGRGLRTATERMTRRGMGRVRIVAGRGRRRLA